MRSGMTVGAKVRCGSQSKKKIENTEDRPSDKTIPICTKIALHISCPSVVISYEERVFWPLDHLNLDAHHFPSITLPYTTGNHHRQCFPGGLCARAPSHVEDAHHPCRINFAEGRRSIKIATSGLIARLSLCHLPYLVLSYPSPTRTYTSTHLLRRPGLRHRLLPCHLL